MYAVCKNSQQDTQVLIFEVKRGRSRPHGLDFFFLHFYDLLHKLGPHAKNQPNRPINEVRDPPPHHQRGKVEHPLTKLSKIQISR